MLKHGTVIESPYIPVGVCLLRWSKSHRADTLSLVVGRYYPTDTQTESDMHVRLRVLAIGQKLVAMDDNSKGTWASKDAQSLIGSVVVELPATISRAVVRELRREFLNHAVEMGWRAVK